MADVAARFIDQFEVKRRKPPTEKIFYALGSRMLRFHGCQFLVRLTSGAHTPSPMSDVFEYKPKFVDIRVKKPDPERVTRAQSDRPCDHIGCQRVGSHRAPKGREHEGQFWHFCVDHAAESNKRWDYFAGMNESELESYRAREEVGHRPTWTFRSGRLDRFSAAARGFRAGRRADAFGLFGGEPVSEPVMPRQRRLTRLQGMALEAMSLDENADAGQIRARYAELVKRWHPDSNGGDRGAEANLQRVIKAYQTLKAAGLV